MRRPIASDFDGTWDDHSELWGLADIIITGEFWKEYDNVMDRWVGPKIPVFFNPVDPEENVMKVVAHKADVINKTRARRFFEDQKEQVTMLKIMCPECEIVWVQPERTFI